MQWWDYILTILSIGCTVFSIIGAYKSNTYYKKSKQLTIYANTNSAFIESQRIIDAMTEMLKLSNHKKRRGINYTKEISTNGEKIKASINKIRQSLPVKDCKEINELLNTQKIEAYVDSFITGTILVDEKFIIDDDFNKCQKTFYDMQLLIKEKLENLSEKLK